MRPLLLLLFSLASPAAGETLQMAVPAGYRQTKPEQRAGDWTTTEWRTPSNEERLRRMIGRGAAFVAPTVHRDAMGRSPFARCTVGSIREGRDNGYAYALWAASCRSTNAAGQIEETWTKAIQGRDALYVVQKAFTYNPFDADVIKWVAYLERVQLCDPGLPDRPCRR
jgi:hypothetical protein